MSKGRVTWKYFIQKKNENKKKEMETSLRYFMRDGKTQEQSKKRSCTLVTESCIYVHGLQAVQADTHTPRLCGRTWIGHRRRKIERDGNIQVTTSRWTTERPGPSQPKHLSYISDAEKLPTSIHLFGSLAVRVFVWQVRETSIPDLRADKSWRC